MTKRVRFVFEVGSNFDGNLATAKKYVRAAKDCGADAVKFQTLRKDLLVAREIYIDGELRDNPAYDSFPCHELPAAWHYELKREADDCGIEFFSTPFYLDAVALLEDVGVQTYKIASGDITFYPLLEAVGKTGKQVILATGASALDDVQNAVQCLTDAGAEDIILLHCVSQYPAEWEQMNIKAMVTLREAFGFPVGISDHSPGSLVPLAAVSLGAEVIEKHVTFDRSLPAADHAFSLTVDEFADMVRRVRILEKALGSGEKRPTDKECEKQKRLRRGIYEGGVWLRPQYELSPIHQKNKNHVSR